jgi:hypothetical protein
LRALGLGDLVDDGLALGRGVDRHVALAADELDDAVEVIGMAVRDEDGQQGLVQRVQACAEGPGVGDEQVAVDRDDSLVGLDQVGVDEQAVRAGGVRVDR